MKEENKDAGHSEKIQVRVLIVDDHWAVLEGVKSALEKEPEFKVVGTASDGLEAVKATRSLKPDIVILDISMPNMNGVQTTSEIKRIDDNIRIIIFSMYSDKEYVISLFRAGISGYVLKAGSITDLVMAAKSVRSGGCYFSPLIQASLRGHIEALATGGKGNDNATEGDTMNLSVREKEILPLLADGLSAREISKRLNISPKTVESHKYNIMEKLNISSLADLTKFALRKKLIKL